MTNAHATTATTTVTTERPWSRKKKCYVTFGLLLLSLGLIYGLYRLGGYVGLGQIFPHHELRVSRLHSEANRLTDREGRAIEAILGDKPDAVAIRRAAQELHAVRAEKEATHFAIDHGTKSCPTGKQREGDNKITLDLSGCESGLELPLHLIDPWKEQLYTIHLYKFGENGKKVPVAVQPVIKLVSEKKPDGFSEARLISAEDDVLAVVYKLRGSVELVTQGDADYVEMQVVVQ